MPILRSVGEALDHAHAQDVVHRDVKPANVLVREDGFVKLADLGIAKAVGATQLTGEGSVIGTLPYMSPERMRGPGAGGPESDVYALAAVAYELLSGEPPGDTASTEAMTSEQQAHFEEGLRTPRRPPRRCSSAGSTRTRAGAPSRRRGWSTSSTPRSRGTWTPRPSRPRSTRASRRPMPRGDRADRPAPSGAGPTARRTHRSRDPGRRRSAASAARGGDRRDRRGARDDRRARAGGRWRRRRRVGRRRRDRRRQDSGRGRPGPAAGDDRRAGAGPPLRPSRRRLMGWP